MCTTPLCLAVPNHRSDAQVRVYDITAFGSVDSVGEKLLDAERKKDGFISVEMLKSGKRMERNATLYDYEVRGAVGGVDKRV